MANQGPLQQLLEVIPAPLRNRYVFVLLVFFIWMFFIDKHDFITQWRLQRSVDKLKAEKEFYRVGIEEEEQIRYDLEVNKEKIAREKYYMKRPNEDVFIIVDEDEQPEEYELREHLKSQK